MAHKHIFIVVSFILLNFGIQAQESATYTHSLVDYQKALTLYNNNQFHAAQTRFDDIKENTTDVQIASDCAYYIANCAVRLNQKNADKLIEDFVEDYPTSTKRNTAYLDVADYYFDNGKYAYARKWYDKVDANSISRVERDKFNFNYGYALYTAGDETNAQTYLNKVSNSTDYGSQAKYYIGFMAYEGDDYDTANAYFEQVTDQEKYKEKLSYYQADLNFKLGKFDKAITLAKAQIDQVDREEASELSKIIGESYFNLEQYSEAIPFLKAYKGKKGKWNNTDYYQLGYAYYKQNDFESAISEFNKIIDGNNSVAQNAYYHLGESYVNLDKKQEALNAFRNASQMDFDLKIQEDAWLNYAKISYEIGNPYQSVPQVLTSYLTKYPKTAYKDEVETLLIDSYITSKNYEEALKLLEGKRSFENRVAFQKVAFYRGIEMYNDAKYSEAQLLFDKSIDEAKAPVFTTRATFWKAETDFHLSNYNEALLGLKQFVQFSEAAETPEMEHVEYNLAYAYFKLKNYDKAREYFQTYIDSKPTDQLRVNDAYLRLGDGYFVSSAYSKAIAAYDKAINLKKIETDYPFFQQAMSYGYLGKGDQKIKELNIFIHNYPKSSLRDDAMYELANSYVKANKTKEAMAMYDRLNSEYKNSAFVSKSLLRQGLSYYNVNDNNKALTKFKTVAKSYPNSEEAVQAVATARLIYIDLGRVDEYAAWIQTLDYISVTDVELDNTTYLAAEKQYLDNNTDKAEEAIVKLSEMLLNNSKWNDAIPLLKRLEGEADYPQNITYAQSNLMNAYYQLENYNDAVLYAENVLNVSKIDNKVKSDAQIIIARSAIKTNNEAKAKTAYANLEIIATGALAAEALYYNAYFKHKEGDYKGSNTTTQKLAKDYSSYKYYSAKGLVLMAKNFDALNEAFQATYILESVITSFPEFEDVVAEAQEELNRIKAEEAKTNSSITTEN